jgi:hypothetical protein
VRVTVDASAGETYKGQSRPYSPSYRYQGRTIVYSWSGGSVRAGSRITVSASFGWRGGRHTHDFARDSYTWGAVSGGQSTSGGGGL